VVGKAIDLPSRFPVGTRYVIEGLRGRISARYVEFPDGRRLELPPDGAPGTISSRKKRSARE
jgi:hypothetical protein